MNGFASMCIRTNVQVVASIVFCAAQRAGANVMALIVDVASSSIKSLLTIVQPLWRPSSDSVPGKVIG